MRYFLKLELDESYAISYHAYKAFTFVQACWNIWKISCLMLYSKIPIQPRPESKIHLSIMI